MVQSVKRRKPHKPHAAEKLRGTETARRQALAAARAAIVDGGLGVHGRDGVLEGNQATVRAAAIADLQRTHAHHANATRV